MKRLRRIVHEVERFYWGSGLCDDVPAIAWFLVVLLVPLSLGLGALATVIFDDAAVRNFAEQAANVFPREVHDQVVALVLETRATARCWSRSPSSSWCGPRPTPSA